MPLITFLGHLLSDRRGAVFVEYSSLALLLAIAAIALFVQFGDAGVPPTQAGRVTAGG